MFSPTRLSCLRAISEEALLQVQQAKLVSVESLKGYQSLQSYVATVVQSCSTVENDTETQQLSLVTFLENTRDKSWADIKLALFKLVLYPNTMF